MSAVFPIELDLMALCGAQGTKIIHLKNFSHFSTRKTLICCEQFHVETNRSPYYCLFVCVCAC